MPSLRAIDRGDARVVAALHAASWRSAYRNVLSASYLEGDVLRERTAHWAQRLVAANETQFGFIAESERVPVGFAWVFGNEDPAFGHLLDNIHVTPERKGEGIGTLLLHEVAREIVRRGWSQPSLFLWVYESNSGARRFYKTHGARHEGTEVHQGADGGKVIACRYVWDDVTSIARVAG